MILCKITNVKTFKGMIDYINNNSDELRLTFNPDALKITFLDRSHVCFSDFTFHKNYFEQYNITEQIQLCVDTTEISTIFSRYKNNEIVTFTLKKNYIEISFTGEYERTFKLHLIHEDYEPPATPPLEYDHHFSIGLDELLSIVSDIDVTGKHKTGENILKFNSLGTHLSVCDDDNVYNINLGECATDDSNSVEDVNSKFSTSFLLNLGKLKGFGDCVMSLGDTMPLKLCLKDVFECVEFDFLLAPRISNEED